MENYFKFDNLTNCIGQTKNKHFIYWLNFKVKKFYCHQFFFFFLLKRFIKICWCFVFDDNLNCSILICIKILNSAVVSNHSNGVLHWLSSFPIVAAAPGCSLTRASSTLVTEKSQKWESQDTFFFCRKI